MAEKYSARYAVEDPSLASTLTGDATTTLPGLIGSTVFTGFGVAAVHKGGSIRVKLA